MKYCKRCLYPENHALNITFNKEGICSGCIVHEEKDYLNWIEREKKLLKILNNYRNNNQTNYDCIIPVSGGKDSYFIVDLIKNKYKMNPLLVTFNKTFNTRTGIKNLQYLKTIFGCDMIQSTPNPLFAKKIVNYTFEKMGNLYWLNHLGTTTFPVQIAHKFKIPLIIWGAHQGIDQVGMFSHTDEVEMTRKYRKEHDLFGYESMDMVDEKNQIFERDLVKYQYPSDQEINEVGVRGIYLNNYIRWDSKLQHENMIHKYNYNTMEQTRTFIPYDNVDCFMYSDLHDYLKFLKFGYSKINDHVSREIRLGHIHQNIGKNLIKKYLFQSPKNIDIFLNWSGLNKSDYTKILNKFNINKYENKTVSFNKRLQTNYIINNANINENKIVLFEKSVY